MAFSINLGAPTGRRHWRLDLTSLPAKTRQVASRGGGLFFVVFSLIWGGFPVISLVSLLRSGTMGAKDLPILIFPIVGLGLLAYGIHTLLWRRTVAFDGQRFTVTERSLIGAKSWSEPLSAYYGVLRRTRRVKTKNSSYTLYMVDLMHPDPARRINLYTDTSEKRFREIWEAYARRLDLPALDEGESGMVRRDAADLDKSVGELIREGKVTVDYDMLARHAVGLAVDIQGDDIVMTRTGPQNPLWSSAIMLFFPLVFVGIAVFVPDMDMIGRVMFGGAGMVFELLFAVGVLGDFTSRARLRIGPEGLRVSKVKRGVEVPGGFIPAAELESVTIGKKDNQWRPAVVASSDRQTLRFGAGLPYLSLQFALNTVLGKIAETTRHDARI